MHILINDPELLWFNFKFEGAPSEKILKLERYTYPIEESAMFALAYVYKNGEAYGLEGRWWQDWQSAKRAIERLQKRNLLDENGSYIKWQFRLVDETGRFIETAKAKRIENNLNNAWVIMLRNIMGESL